MRSSSLFISCDLPLQAERADCKGRQGSAKKTFSLGTVCRSLDSKRCVQNVLMNSASSKVELADLSRTVQELAGIDNTGQAMAQAALQQQGRC